VTRAYYASILVSSTLFLFYGVACLSFQGMKRDFERFGLSRFRVLTGTLEVLGALGLVLGQFWTPRMSICRQPCCCRKRIDEPNTTVPMPAQRMAAMHMGHGSAVV
jgi:hypothetical protein